MHSNLHLLFWDTRRDKKSKANQSTPSYGNLFSMGKPFKRKFKAMGKHYAKSTFTFAPTNLYNFILHIN